MQINICRLGGNAAASFVLGVSIFDKVGTIIATAVVELCLPILYVWGAFKEPTA